MDILEVTGEKVRELRDQCGWTRAKLSEESGVPERTIADIELGTSKSPSLETIKSMLRALPNYVSTDRSDLLFGLIARLPSLDENELRAVEAVIDRALAKRSRSARTL